MNSTATATADAAGEPGSNPEGDSGLSVFLSQLQSGFQHSELKEQSVMHYASTDAIVAEIADEMDVSSTKAVELLDQVTGTESLDSLRFLSTDLIESYEWNEDDEREWSDESESDFDQA
jgi:hypothetical protein